MGCQSSCTEPQHLQTRDIHATYDWFPSAPMNSIAQDLSFAVRTVRRRAGFAATVMATLALGIGASTAIFSLIDGVLIKPVRLPAVAQLVALFQAQDARGANIGSPYGLIAYGTYVDLSRQTRTFASLAAFRAVDVVVERPTGSEQVSGELASPNYFTVLGVAPALGRFFSPADTANGAEGSGVVLGYDYWRSTFGADRRLIGQGVRIAGKRFTVLGVAPVGFRGTDLAAAPVLWFPTTAVRGMHLPLLASAVALRSHVIAAFSVVGRLASSTPLAAASAEADVLMHQIETANPPQRALIGKPVHRKVSVLPIVEAAAIKDRPNLVRFVRILLGVVGLTLLLACVSVANLLYVRGIERANEMAVRFALGAARGRIVRQLLLENLLLALGGGAFGLAIAAVTMKLLASFTLPGSVSLNQVPLSLDGRVLGFALALSIVTAVLFGLGPAVRATSAELGVVIRQYDAHGQARTPRSALLVAEVAISVILLTGALLFVRSLRAGLNADLGFDPNRLAAITLDPRLKGYDSTRTAAVFRDVVAAAQRLPGVQYAALTSHVPLAHAFALPFGPWDGRRSRYRRIGSVR